MTAPRTDTARTRALRVVWIYPDLLSTYGDQGNVIVLAHRAAARGYAVERVDVRSDQKVPEDGDVYLIGGGEDRPQRLAAEHLAADPGLTRAVAGGAALLAVCAGFQLIGHRFHDGEEDRDGLGLLDVWSERGTTRCVGEVVADAALGLPVLTGFENHAGVTRLGPGASPLGTVRVGNGNAYQGGVEGAHAGRIVGTYLHGPVLARNPALADLLLAWAVGVERSELPPCDDTWTERLRADRLSTAGAR